MANKHSILTRLTSLILTSLLLMMPVLAQSTKAVQGKKSSHIRQRTQGKQATSNALISVQSNPAVSLSYGYDALNRLKTVVNNNLPEGANVTTYEYDKVGNLISISLPNGVVTTYTYNAVNRLTNVKVEKSGSIIARYDYTLGPAGNKLSVKELSGRTVAYSYDAIYRITSESIAGDTINNGVISYIYDKVGNRLQRSSTIPTIPVQQFSYDANDRTTTGTYDSNGNITVSGDQAYSYDAANRLIKVDEAARGLSIRLFYNDEGERVAKIVTQAGSTVATRYLVDRTNPTGYSQVLAEIQNGQLTRRYAYGLNLISQEILINGQYQVFYYGYDGQGNVRFLTDGSGNITDRYDYDAFGNLINQVGSTPNNYLYTGEQFDFDLGGYYLRARYMNPSTGRFWTMDNFEGILTEPPTLHKYIYTHNSPANFVDPSGNSASATKLNSVALATRIFVYAASGAIRLGQQAQYVLRGAAEILDDAASATSRIIYRTASAPKGIPHIPRVIFRLGEEGEAFLARVFGGNSQVTVQTSRGIRVLDQLANRVAHESKVGYVQYGQKVLDQIAKDKEILQRNLQSAEKVVWHFFRSADTGKIGADPRVLQELHKSGIDYIIYY